MQSGIFREYARAEQLAAELSLAVEGAIWAAVSARGTCHMVVPGGRSPRRFFEHLRECDLPWQCLHLYLSDERCVPVGDSERNDRLLEEVLLPDIDLPFDQLHRIPAEFGPEEGARRYAETLQSVPAFDIAILGMGPDGHIASLFPCHPALQDIRDAVPVVAAPKAPFSRVSVGLSRLRAATSRHVIAVGAEKQAVFAGDDPLTALPVLQLEATVWCAWMSSSGRV